MGLSMLYSASRGATQLSQKSSSVSLQTETIIAIYVGGQASPQAAGSGLVHEHNVPYIYLLPGHAVPPHLLIVHDPQLVAGHNLAAGCPDLHFLQTFLPPLLILVNLLLAGNSKEQR